MKPLNIILCILSTCFFCAGAQNNNVDLMVEARISNTGFIGEALAYEVVLYSSTPNIADVKSISDIQFPESFKIIRGTSRGKAERISKGKYKYAWVILREYVIPEDAGKFKIPGGDFVVFIPHERIVNRGFWGSSRVVEYEELRTQCNTVNVKINKLPKANSDFSGCVGDFKIESWFPRGAIYTGNEAYAIFKISGYGYLHDVHLPPLNKLFVNGCHLKEVEQNEELLQRDGNLFTEVTLICKFVPEEESFEVGNLCLNFFNNATGKYYTACSDILKWENTPSKNKKSSSNNDAIAI